MDDRDWYENALTETERELYDEIEDMCPEFCDRDADECQEFMDELSELGITTGEQFVKAYTYQTDSDNAEAEFAKYFKTEVERIDLDKVIDYYKVTSGVGAIIVDGVIDWQKTWDHGVILLDGVIDWQETWDRGVCYEFSSIEFGDETYFFSNDIEEDES